jgi:hypothetical protein
MKIHEVGPETLHLVEPLLDRWLTSKHCLHTREQIMADVQSGAWSLWAVVKGRDVIGLYAIHIGDTPKGRVLDMPFLVGNGVTKFWPLIDDHLSAVAKEYGASVIALTGRPGWARVVRDRFSLYHVVLVREVA